MLKYRKYIIFWLIFSIIYILGKYPSVFGLSSLALRVNNAFLLENQSVVISKYHLTTQPDTITKVNNNLSAGEYRWISKYIGGGEPGYDKTNYQVVYDPFFDSIIEYSYLGAFESYIAMKPNYYLQGANVEVGSFFTAHLSRYGVNCVGCTGENSGVGNFSVGISADINQGIRQHDGNWQAGLTFEGYYIVASDPALPLCTVLKFSEHSLQGLSIKAGKPFYAVVLDRGGAIKENRLDFYIGDERTYNSTIKYASGGNAYALVEVVAFGNRALSGAGTRSCSLPDINTLP
ncbi:MAG: hypothetical protein ACK5G7_03765 [Erysipelotrichaceae bacterium]